jgi:hypothetical protein
MDSSVEKMIKFDNFAIVSSRILEARERDPMCPKFERQTSMVHYLDLGPFDDISTVINAIFGTHEVEEKDFMGVLFVFDGNFWGHLEIIVVKRSKLSKRLCNIFTEIYEGIRKVCCCTRKNEISQTKFHVPLIDLPEQETLIESTIIAEPSFTAIPSPDSSLISFNEGVNEMASSMFGDKWGYEMRSQPDLSIVSSSEFVDTHVLDVDDLSFFYEKAGDGDAGILETESGPTMVSPSGFIPMPPIHAAHDVIGSRVRFAVPIEVEAISNDDLDFIREFVDEMVEISLAQARFFAREWK